MMEEESWVEWYVYHVGFQQFLFLQKRGPPLRSREGAAKERKQREEF